MLTSTTISKTSSHIQCTLPIIQHPQLLTTPDDTTQPCFLNELKVSPRAPLLSELGKQDSLFESFDATQIGVGIRSSDDTCLFEGTTSYQLLKTDTTGNILSDEANMLRVCGRINSIVSKVNRVLQKQGGVGNPYASTTPTSIPSSTRLQPLSIPASPSKNIMCRKSSFTDDDIAGLYTSTPCAPSTQPPSPLASTLSYKRISSKNINNWMQPDQSPSHIDRTASYLHSKSEADGECMPRGIADARISSPSMWALSLTQSVSESSSGSAASSPSATRKSNELSSPIGQVAQIGKVG
ncbi:hypothetical protein EON65_58780, partial [archaeon]